MTASFQKITLSQSNVRRIKTGISIEDLAEDIARRGLLQGNWMKGELSPENGFSALIERTTMLDLPENLQLRRVLVMGVNRIELSGFTDTMRKRLSAYGLFHEITSWKLRMFVPADASGPAILGRLLERYPVERLSEREGG